MEVIKFVGNASGLKIEVKWSALAAAGIGKNTTVTVSLKNVSVAALIRAILRDVGGPVRLGFVVRDGVVVISTKDDLAGG